MAVLQECLEPLKSHDKFAASHFGRNLPHVISMRDLSLISQTATRPCPPAQLVVLGSDFLAGVYYQIPAREINGAGIFARIYSSAVTMTIYKPSAGKWVFAPRPFEPVVFAEASSPSIQVPKHHAKWFSPGSGAQIPVKVRTNGAPSGVFAREMRKQLKEVFLPEPPRGTALKTPTELLKWRWQQRKRELEVGGRPYFIKDNSRSDLSVFNETYVQGGYRSSIPAFRENSDTRHLLNLGGNNGMVARWALQQGIARVDLYEPSKEMFFIAWYNTLGLPVTVHQAAVGVNRARMQFCDQANTTRGSLRSCLAHHLDGRDVGNQYEVPVEPFNEVLQDCHDELIIDIEGGELPILLCPQTDYKRIRLLKGEISGVRLRKRFGSSGWMAFGKILANLRRAGFTHIKYDGMADKLCYWEGDVRTSGLDFKLMASRGRNVQNSGRNARYTIHWRDYKRRMARQVALSCDFARKHKFALCQKALCRSYRKVIR